MSAKAKRLVAFAILFALQACRAKAPKDHTSLVLDPGKDPGKPGQPLSMVWLHHSTGDNLLKGGLLNGLKANNIVFHDINYKESTVDGYVIGDHTDTKDFPQAFNTPKYFAVIKTWELKDKKKKHHDIVMFKSCFPNSNIKSDEMLKGYKAHYQSLLSTFEAHPQILFVGMSTPPLVKKHTTPENAKRARAWAKWVTSEYAKKLQNVAVFDLFNALAIREGKPDANTLVPQFATDEYDSHPNDVAAQAMLRLFIPWLNRAIRRAGLVD